MKVISLFSGCGGFDLGFKNAGFEIVYANDFDKAIWETYEKNHKMLIDKRNIKDVPSAEIPDAEGIIGGPPCQSWSLAGAMRGIHDERGQVFYEYIRVLNEKQPLFFVAENVPGICSRAHLSEFEKIIMNFKKLKYNVNYKQLKARDYGVAQERNRVFIVGYHESLGKKFEFPNPTHVKEPMEVLSDKTLKNWFTLREAIGDLPVAKPAKERNKSNESLEIPNHEYMNGDFSSIYMSRNRRREWDEQSFTIQAGGRHAPLHPSSSKMHKVDTDKCEFEGEKPKIRRLSIRECARIQSFPDNFIFYYTNVNDGYKMVGNAVPVKVAEVIAKQIKDDLEGH